jgi:Methyltransferase domain
LKSILKRYLQKAFPSLAAAYEGYKRIRSGSFPIYLDYPINALPRYGWGKASHRMLYEAISANRAQYGSYIQALRSFKDGLANIPSTEEDPLSPYWSNRYMRGLDAAALYAFPKLFGSQLYLEIGSGNSTKFVKRSVIDNRLKTKIISIDPFPRAEVDSLCDEVVRKPLETVDLELFDQLEEGDILMVDCSHRTFQNSDATVVFLEILPRLKPGVMIYIDDIYLLDDYPPHWSPRYYSEAYLLAVLLLSDRQNRYEILLPGWFICLEDELGKMVEESWKEIGLGQYVPEAKGFWMRVREERN